MEINSFLLGALENVLGKGYRKSKGNTAFMCPFCHHPKPKLEVNLEDSEKGENPWQCWVCLTKGKTIRSLLKQMRVTPNESQEILHYVKKGEGTREYVEVKQISLPEGFKPLHSATSTSVVANSIRYYLEKRGLTEADIIRYNVGYSITGTHSGTVIIPSYNGNNQLNYFIARSYNPSARRKYINPDVSKDIIFFENLINWNEPVILCEGVFDAMAIKRNAIPILGKIISKSLMKKLISSPGKDIYIALDRDALKQALEHAQKFLDYGKRVFLINLDQKDPSEMGFETFTKKIQTATELDFSTLMQYKLSI